MKHKFSFILIVLAFFTTTLFAIYSSASALESNHRVEYSWLSELDKVTELNEHGFPVVRLDKAEELGLDNEALEVGRVLNEIVTDIETNGESTALARMDRSLFSIGSYGNYCGYGNNGYSIPAIDDLDMACFYHDKCFKGFLADNRSCNAAFLTRLSPIVANNAWNTTKGAYARAAVVLFSRFV
ncbi:phospholipase A2 family protein [Streptococcus mitis]|nr:phospholipase A2 family protein [Streptococcus mitis]